MARRLAEATAGGWSDDRLAAEAVELAAAILRAAQRERRLGERYQAWKLHRMLDDPWGKAFTLAMADQVFRPRSAWRAASQFRHLVVGFGAPEYLPLHERIGLMLAAGGSFLAPDLVMEAVTSRMRAESKQVVLPAEDQPLERHVAKRRKMGARLNLNLLGEAILGEEEAERRLAGQRRAIAQRKLRLHFGQDHIRLQPGERPGLRRHAGEGEGATASALSSGDGEPGRRTGEVREPRHGGVSRPAPDLRRLQGGPRRGGVSGTWRRESFCRPTCRTPMFCRRSSRRGRGIAGRGAGQGSSCGS